MGWIKIHKTFASEEQAHKTASIIATTEARLANQRVGPQYEIETRVEQVEGGWQVTWRKVLVGYASGCGGCESCDSRRPKVPAKIIPFKRP